MLSYKDFPEFYGNPFIKSIAADEKWTISDATKRPIDMWDLVLTNPDLSRKPTGAWSNTPHCLMDLASLCKYVPHAANNAYFFDYQSTGCVLLDVEPTCPDELKAVFLGMDYIYGETSMSGKGYHLVFRTPDCIAKYPNAAVKQKLQDSQKRYEFLLYHYVTFTRNMIPPAKPGAGKIDAYFEQMCALAKQSEKKISFDVDAARPKPVEKQDIAKMTLQNYAEYKKEPKDFDGDMSRYEFGYAAYLYAALERILAAPSYNSCRENFTNSIKAWLVYDVLVERLKCREKHASTRDGLPWLLYLAQEAIAKNTKTGDEK